MFSNIKNMTVPVVVTDAENRVVFKNSIASKYFPSVRVNSVLTHHAVRDQDADTVESLLSAGIPAMLVMRFAGDMCCCIVTGKVIEGEEFRFYTPVPYIFEFCTASDAGADGGTLLKDFRQCFINHIQYIMDCLDGHGEKISAAVKGRVRAAAKRILNLENVLNSSLGAKNDRGFPDPEYKRNMDVASNLDILVSVFNKAAGKEYMQLKYVSVPRGLKCCMNSASFGRLFVYTAFFCTKFSKSSPVVSVKEGDTYTDIEFRIGTKLSGCGELCELDMGYIRSYAEKYGFTIRCDDLSSKGSTVTIRLEETYRKGLCNESFELLMITAETVEEYLAQAYELFGD